MKLFRAEDIRNIEQTAAGGGLTLEEMMQNAGEAAADFIREKIEVSGRKILILCGKGNNGGDGCVCAESLARSGAGVSVLLTHGLPSSKLAKDAFDRMSSKVRVIHFEKTDDGLMSFISHQDVIIDAVFGFSFHGDITSPTAELIEFMNRLSSPLKVSIDLPSGVVCDDAYVGCCAFKADYTVTFSAEKPAFFLHPGKQYCGAVRVASVGIQQQIIDDYKTNISLLGDEDFRSFLPYRDPLSNKGSFGRLLMICGSYGMAGACIMAARAALRSGLGLLNIAVPDELYRIIAPSVPEAVFTILGDSDDSLLRELNRSTAVVCGCGLGNRAGRFVELLLGNSKAPVVFDADALNYIAENPEMLLKAQSDIVITPHPGEMSRLCGKSIRNVQASRILTAQDFSAKYNVITVLKGSGTVISSPSGVISLNSTGNSGMSKGGSGDVLAGMLGSLAAQKLDLYRSSCAAVYFHGMAGDMAESDLSQTSMLPTDLISYLPKVFGKFERTLKERS